MAVVIRLVGPISQIADGKEEISVQGQTVGEVIESLCTQFPDFATRFMKDGKLSNNVRMTFNDELIQFLDDGMDTTVNENDELILLSALAGG